MERNNLAANIDSVGTGLSIESAVREALSRLEFAITKTEDSTREIIGVTDERFPADSVSLQGKVVLDPRYFDPAVGE